MFSYRVLVVDDEEMPRRATIISLELYVPRENILSAGTVQEAKQILSSAAVDLAILDISMRQENGFQLAEYMQQEHPGVPYIFLTGHTEFALAGYRYQPLGFLVKPVNAAALGELLEKVEPAAPREDKVGQRVGITTGKGFHLLDVDSILYIQKEGRNAVVQMTDSRFTLPKYTLDRAEEVFQEHGFVRVHQSYIISLRRIREVVADPFGRSYEIVLSGTEERIPLSRTRLKELRELLQNNRIRFL